MEKKAYLKDQFLVVELCPGTDPEYFAPRLLAHVILHGCDGLFGGGCVAVGHNASDGKVRDAEKKQSLFLHFA